MKTDLLEELLKTIDHAKAPFLAFYLGASDRGESKKEGTPRERAQAALGEIRSKLAKDSALLQDRLNLASEGRAALANELDEKLAYIY